VLQLLRLLSSLLKPLLSTEPSPHIPPTPSPPRVSHDQLSHPEALDLLVTLQEENAALSARAGQLTGQLEEIAERARELEGEGDRLRARDREMRVLVKGLEKAVEEMDRLTRY
jgi:hypothetical protein